MTQNDARNIVKNIAEKYVLDTLEKTAIITILEPKEHKRIGEEDMSCDRETSYLVCPNCGWEFANNNFCSKCGQPLINDEE